MDKISTLMRKLRVLYARLKHLPTKFWLILGSLFGFFDFLTWSFLSNLKESQRIYFTLGIVLIAFLIACYAVWSNPTKNEQIEKARELYRNSRYLFQTQEYYRIKLLLKESVSLDDQSPGSWALLGRTLIRIGEYAEAIEALENAIKTTQINEATYRHNVGVAHSLLGNFGDAMNFFDKTLELKPERFRTLRWRAQIWLSFNQNLRAIDDANQAIKIRPNHGSLYSIRSISYFLCNQQQEGFSDIQTAKTLNSDSAEDFYYLALACAHSGEDKEAASYLKVAISKEKRFKSRIFNEPLLKIINTSDNFNSVVNSIATSCFYTAEN